MDPKKEEDFNFVLQKIKEHLPLLIKFLDNNKSLIEYSKALYDFKLSKVHLERQKPLIKIINKKIKELFTIKQIKEMNLNLEKGIISNIVDHHNILNHPILISSHIISNMCRFMNKDKQGIFVLTCGGVPFNNGFHKRGLTFNNKIFPIIRSKEGDRIIHFSQKRELNFLDSAEKNNLISDFSDEEKKFIQEYQKIISGINIDKAKDFVDEITLINYRLFPLMFNEEIREDIPALVFFECEYLATEMLKELFQDENNFIFKIFFNEKYRNLVISTFNGIWGAWNTQRNLGTHFFWYMQENGEEVSMEYKEGYLVPKKEGLDSIKWDKNIILNLLKEKRIYPNIFLFYAIILFYCGIKPLTGLGSMNYLTDMKNAWIKVMTELEPKESELIKEVDTMGLIAAPIATYSRKNEKIIEQYFADVVFRGGLTKEYLNNLGKMKFKDLLKTSLISNYDIKVPANEKKPLSLTVDDLVGQGFGWIK